MVLARWFLERTQRAGATPWAAAHRPPELVEAIEGPEAMEPGRALELGCGTGANVLYLAQHGWFAVGVDASSAAIESARRKADWVSGATFVEGDVTKLGDLGIDGPFDLLLDIGCLHSVPSRRRDDYVREAARVARPEALLLLFALGSWLRIPGSSRTREAEVRRRFEGDFEIERVRPSTTPAGAAWFWMRRRPG